MDRRVRAEFEVAAVFAFHFVEDLRVVVFEAREHGGVQDDPDGGGLLRLRALLQDFEQAALDLHAHADGGFHVAGAAAVGARVEQRILHAFALALARHLHEPELADREDFRACAVEVGELVHRAVDLLAVGAVRHVDEVDDDLAADVAEAYLARDLLRGLEVGVQDELALRLAGLGFAGVDVDGDERFGLVDAQVAAAGEVHDAVVDFGDLRRDLVAVEHGFGALVARDLRVEVVSDEFLERFDQEIVFVLVVDHDLVDVVRQQVAHGAFQQVGFGVDERGRLRLQQGVVDLRPEFQQHFEVALEEDGLAVFADGAADEAHSVRELQPEQDFAEAVAFLFVLDARGEADVLGVGEQDQVAAGDGDVRRDARALGSDGALRDLHEEFGPGGEDARDVLDGDLAGVDALLHLLQALGAVAARHEVAELLAEDGDDVLFLLRGGVGLLDAFALLADLFDAVEDVVGGREHVAEVHERVLLRADVDEAGFQARFDADDLAEVDGPGDDVVALALDLVVLQMAVDEQCRAGLKFLAVQDDLFFLLRHDLDETFTGLAAVRGCRSAGRRRLRGGRRSGNRRRAFPFFLRARCGRAAGNRSRRIP